MSKRTTSLIPVGRARRDVRMVLRSSKRSPNQNWGGRTRLERRPGRVRDPERARAAIVLAAQNVFARDGYFATTSNEIAKAAGYAPGSFYTHFSDKREVFLEVYESWVSAEWDAVEVAMQGPRTARARIAAAIAMLAAHHKRTHVFRKSLRALAATEPTVHEAQNAQRKRQIAWLKELCVAEGWPKPTDSVCAVVLFSIERVLDGVGDGDMAVLEADERSVCRELSHLTYSALKGDT